MAKESMIFYASFLKGIELLPTDAQKLKALLSILTYGLKEEDLPPDDDIARAIYEMAKPQVAANMKKAVSGSNGGRPPKKTNGYENEKPMVIENENHRLLSLETNGYENEKPNVNENDNENVNEKEIKEKDNANALSKKKTAKRFVPPTTDEVRAYCLERRNTVNADAFIAFYESNGWKVGKNSMKDWKAAIRTWEQRESRAAPKQDAVDIWLQEALAKKEVDEHDRAGISENSQYAACVS